MKKKALETIKLTGKCPCAPMMVCPCIDYSTYKKCSCGVFK